MTNLLTLLLPPLVFGVAAWQAASHLTRLAAARAESAGLMAEEDHRTSHSGRIPRAGGVGLVPTILVLLAIAYFAAPRCQTLAGYLQVESFDTPGFWGLLACTAAAFLLGLWDDRGDPPAIAKLAGQVVIAAAVPALGLSLHQIDFPGVGVVFLPGPVGAAVAFVLMLLMMNAVNFMDGINGLAGRFLFLFGVVILGCGLNWSFSYEYTLLGAVLCGASHGFLEHNFPRARTFLGDCGSQAIGALVAGSILLFANNAVLKPIPGGGPGAFPSFTGLLLACSVLVFDVLFTLGRRSIRGENILKPHRSHLYQRHLIATGEDHVTTGDFVNNSNVAVAVIAFLYVRFSVPEDTVFRGLAIVAVAATLWLYHLRVVRAERAAAARTLG